MPSKTKFFNMTLLGKNFTRFWPLWAVYLAAWVIAMPVLLAAEFFGPQTQWYIPTALSVSENIYSLTSELSIIAAFGMSVLCAMAVLSYLFTARSSGFMHSLPITRGGMYTVNFVSGYLFMLIPNFIVMLLAMAVTAAGGVAAFGACVTWFLFISGMELFFFSFAVLCGVMTGQLLMLPVFYVILNFVVVGMRWMFDFVARVFLYGYSSVISPLWSWFSPPVALVEKISTNYVYNEASVNLDGSAAYTVSLNGGKAIVIYAIVGIVLAVAAYLFYRIRPNESAGDSIAFGPAKIVFKLGVGFCSAFTLGLFLYELISVELLGVSVSAVAMAFFAIIAGLIGYYAAEMLMEKSFKVFKSGRRCAVALMAIIAAVCAVFAADPLGYSHNVPDPQDIDSAYVTISSYNYYSGNVTDADNILLLTELHQALIDNKAQQLSLVDSYRGSATSDITDGDIGSVSIYYSTADGRKINRRYSVYYSYADLNNVSTVTGLANALVVDPEFVASSTFSGLKLEEITSAEFEYSDESYNWQSLNLTKAEWTSLYNAIVKDVKDGNISNDALFPDDVISGKPYADEAEAYAEENVDEYDYEYAATSSETPYYMSDIYFHSENTSAVITPKPEMLNLIAALTDLGIFDRTGVPASSITD